MKRSLFNKWLKRLRHKNAKPFIGYLQNPYQFWSCCCLGHLCVVAGLEKTIINNRVYYSTSNDKNMHYLPHKFADEIGMNEYGDPIVGFIDEFESLSQMNDEGASPSEIADHLEKHWDRYFEIEEDENETSIPSS